MARIAEAALLVFVALMGVGVPAPPVPVHAAWADLAMPVAATAWAAAILRRELPFPRGARKALVPALGYLGCAALSALVHHAGGYKLLGLCELVMVMLVAATLSTDPARRDRLLRVLIVAAAVHGAVGLVVGALAAAGLPTGPFLVGFGELRVVRPAGLCSFGMLAELSLVPLCVLIFDGKRLFPRARATLLLLIGTALFFTLTRTLLALGVALVCWNALRVGRWRVAAVGVALLVALALISMHVDIHGRDAEGIRWRIAASAAHHAAEHPLLGLGLTASPALANWPQLSDPPSSWDAHSTALDIAATLGSPALACFVLVLIAVASAARKATRTPLALALLAGFAATVFDALSIDVEDFRHVWLLFGVLLGLP